MSNLVRNHFFDKMNCFLFEFPRRESSSFGLDDFQPIGGIVFFLERVFSFSAEILLLFSDAVKRKKGLQVLFANRSRVLSNAGFLFELHIYLCTYFKLTVFRI